MHPTRALIAGHSIQRCTGLFLAAALGLGAAAPAQAETREASAGHLGRITVCDDDAERPPYTFFKRRDGVRSAELTGYSVEVLSRILAAQHMLFSLDLLPWRRCLAQVQAGTTDLVLSLSRSPEREHLFLLTVPYYQMRLAYFYDASRTAPQISSREDLQRQRLCLAQGYNYAPYGVTAGSPAVTGTAKTVGQAFVMLKAQRCDVVPERLETAIGYRLQGIADFEQLGLSYKLLPGLAPQEFHMGVSPATPHAQALLQLLNAGLERLRETGQLTAIAKAYGISN